MVGNNSQLGTQVALGEGTKGIFGVLKGPYGCGGDKYTVSNSKSGLGGKSKNSEVG